MMKKERKGRRQEREREGLRARSSYTVKLRDFFFKQGVQVEIQEVYLVIRF